MELGVPVRTLLPYVDQLPLVDEEPPKTHWGW